MNHNERGNAFVYILIAVALFAALTFILARQEDSKEAGVLEGERAKLMANQLINSAGQVKSALDQMVFAGTAPEEFDFTGPGDINFDESDPVDNLDKVFHPNGGGITLQLLPKQAITSQPLTNPPPGWYLGRFNHVEWTPTTHQDVLLTAYGIREEICAELNHIIVGDPFIPTLNTDISTLLVDANDHTGSNSNFMATDCPSGNCEEIASLCVVNSGIYGFYNILFSE